MESVRYLLSHGEDHNGGSTAMRTLPAPIAPRPRSPARQQDACYELASQDRLFAGLGLLLWAATAIKIAPALTHADNAQSVAGLVAMFVISVAWPSLGPCSYQRWRTPALSALRLFLFLLPYQYTTSVQDAIVPKLATGRMAWASNASNLIMGTHVAMLLFTSLGWHLPLRVHMPLQAVMVALLVCFGVHPHCQTKLLSSPQVQALVSAAHQAASFATAAVVCPAVLITPRDPYAQTAAALIFLWLVLGWLLPTLLLLLPQAAAAGTSGATGQPAAAAAAGSASRGSPHGCQAPPSWLDRWEAVVCTALLKLLLTSNGQRDNVSSRETSRRPADDVRQEVPPHCLPQLPPRALLALRWLLTLLVLWLAACAVAPLYSPPPAAVA